MTAPDDPPSNELHAHDSQRIYQAAGNQYIFGQPPSAPPTIAYSLPRDTAAFTGRDEEVQRLINPIREALGDSGIIPIEAVDGMPGVGKTALAVHVGHLVKQDFPDGQLFMDLHAHTDGQAPVEPAVALEALLSADGVPPNQIPAGVDARTALWRGRMAGRKTLIIVDDAAGSTQVEPLLPGADRCLVIITSRRRLTGLSIRYAPMTLSLDTLTRDEGIALFIRLAGREPAPGDQEDIANLVHLCGFLPLTICLMAAKFSAEPQWSVAELVSDLTATQDRLAHLYAEDVAIPAVAFDLSYRDLPPARQRFFRRLGLHPGADFDAYAAAALDDIDRHDARRHLEALYEDHLVTQPVRGRYRMHDLIREYARARAWQDPPEEAEQAVTRLLGYYAYVAGVASHQVATRPLARTSVRPPATPDVSRPERARAWLRAEFANVMAGNAHANNRGLHRHVVALTAALAPLTRLTGPWHEAIAMHHAAALAAQAIGDRAGRADALWYLGVHLRRTGDYQGAGTVLRDALDIYRDLHERLGEADALKELGNLRRMTGRLTAADMALQSALAIYRDLGDRDGTAAALTTLGTLRFLANDCQDAARILTEALTIFQELGDRRGQAGALLNLGVIRRFTDDYPGALQALHGALAGYTDVGDRLGRANVRHNMGILHGQVEDYPEAARALREALESYQQLGDRLGQANALKQLAIVYRNTEDYPLSVESLREALAIYRDLGDRFGQADALNNLAEAQRLLGEFPAAMNALQRAQTLYRRLGSRLGQAKVANRTGALVLQCGEVGEAIRHYELARGLALEAQSPSEEAHALEGLAWCCLKQEDVESAATRLRQALAIYRRIGAPEATRAAALLDTLGA